MRPACLLLAAALAAAGAAANSDVPGQLRDLKSSFTTAPPQPASLAPALKKRLDGRALSSLSPALQRALLWDAGQIYTGAGSRYVDLYVLCGQTTNNVFLSPTGVASDDCPLKPCKQFTMNIALSECKAASLESRALCAVVADNQPGGAGASTASDLTAYTGPLWSQEGNIDDSFAPRIYRNAINASSSLYVVSQNGNFAGVKDSCASTASFVVPCRRVDRSEVTEAFEEKKWCRPQAQLGVDLWYASETSAPSAGSSSTPSSSSPSTTGDTTGTTSSSSNTATIALGIGLGVAVVVVIVLLVLLSKRKNQSKQDTALPTHSQGYVRGSVVTGGANASSGATAAGSHGGDSASTTYNSVNVEAVNDRFRQQSVVLAAFCEDSDLMMKRVAYTSLQFHKLIASGANGEVWRGEYQGQTVAIKKALADKKEDVKTLETFSHEIRLASALEHPNIVRFIGLSWRTLPDLCIVSEFMAQGDLAHLLSTSHGKALTWKDEKLGLAFDIANALVYLHSLLPVIIHRDLKSLNVLLTDDLHAKLSDFGLSREQSFEHTMTSGVGTVLWTAPEVLRGERYSEKADLYSLGVVLSELDTCLPPYSLNPEVAGVKSKSMHLLPLISKGQISPRFSDSCPAPILELAQACLSHDPEQRPPAMQVVYMLRSKIRPLL